MIWLHLKNTEINFLLFVNNIYFKAQKQVSDIHVLKSADAKGMLTEETIRIGYESNFDT